MSTLIFHNRPALRRPILMLAFGGWNDAGQAATTALRFAAQELVAQPYVSFDPEEFYDFTVVRPTVRLSDETRRMIDWVSVDCLSAQVSTADHDFVFGWGPEPHLKWKTFSNAVLEMARACDAQMVVTLGAFLAEVLYDNPVPVTGFASDPALMAQWNIQTTRYEGPTGIVGVLGDVCRNAAVPHVSLWAGLPHYIAALPNPRGALALLLRLTEALPLPLDLTPLQNAAAQFEQNVEEAIASDAKLSTFVGELRKRGRVN